MVDEVAEVRITEVLDEGTTVYELQVAAGDRGRVIGRRGRTADALRTLVAAVGRRRGISCDMEVVD